MILLKENTINSVVLTLREVSTLSSPYYVFVFKSDDTGVEKVFTGVDVSANIVRYNEFNIEVNPVEDLENSVVDLAKGFYKYKIYTTSVQNDLDLNNVEGLVESGKVYVDGDEQLTKSVYDGGNNTKVVYNG